VKIRASQINGCAACTDAHTKDAQHAGKARSGSTWSRHGGRRQSSPTPSGSPWNSPSRAPASPPPAASPTRPGRTPPSTMTTSSPRWYPSSPSSTPATASTSSSNGPEGTTSPASGDNGSASFTSFASRPGRADWPPGASSSAKRRPRFSPMRWASRRAQRCATHPSVAPTGPPTPLAGMLPPRTTRRRSRRWQSGRRLLAARLAPVSQPHQHLRKPWIRQACRRLTTTLASWRTGGCG
jgi:hypothetical protein